MRFLLAGTLATVTAAGLAAIRPPVLREDEETAAREIRDDRMRADIRFLSSDLLEGRARATRGDALARAYIESRLEAMGLEPGAPGRTWEQTVDLVGVTARCPPVLRVGRGDAREDLHLLDDYVAYSGVPESDVGLRDAEIVFVGYGIVAPEYRWDDYEGADLRGRVLLFLNDEPEADPKLFAGERRSYYSRWHYKHEMAAKVGAAGAILLHTEASAGYSWKEVQASWTGEQLSLPAAPGEPTLPVKAWVTEDAGRRIARLAGRDLDDLRAAAETRAFRPVDLGVRVSLTLRNDVRRSSTANVIGLLRGCDPDLAREAVLYTAHHDHHAATGPSGEPAVANGVLDDASGVAALLGIAEAFVALPAHPRRSILFAAVAAEEHGLLGSEHLARHLPVPVGRLAANINMEGMNIRGRTRDVPVVGLGRSSLDDWIRAVAEAQGRVVVPERFPDEGVHHPSDHDHQPSDGLTPEWDLAGAVADAQLLFYVGAKVADSPLAPAWRRGDEFEAARRRARAEVPGSFARPSRLPSE